MKLIINIDDKDYEELKDGHIPLFSILDVIQNSTPFDKISDEVNKLKKVSDGNKVYVGINDVLDLIDKYENIN